MSDTPIDKDFADWACGFLYDEHNDLTRKLAAAQADIAVLRNTLKKATRLLREGKAQFAPHTTNSEVDDFLRDIEVRGE
jgi:hypothetical protein